MNAIETRRRMRGQGGFTLIELLVVIAILAVLAGVVVFAVSGINNSSQQTACTTEARTVKTAVQAFYAQENKYPTSATDTTTNSAGTAEPFVGGLLEAAPKNVTITYSTDGVAKPTYAWTALGKCVALQQAGKIGAP